MKLDKVTITGADESVKPEDLVEISKEFPFVEWGILVSINNSKEGTNRFPGWRWFFDAKGHLLDGECQLSVHICGSAVRTLALEGKWSLPPHVINKAQRVQLNFHGQKLDFHDGFTDSILPKHLDNQFIFQMDGANNAIIYKALYDGCNVVPLFDGSHGMGVLPNSWPKPIPGLYNGYAGGLGPDNLADELEKIASIAGEEKVWVDMETKVRSNDDKQFDLDKVVRCLEIAKPMVT